MNPESGFAPVARSDARILVLGSMPSRQSLDQHEYYGNPHNAFWRIISDYSGVAATEDYARRVRGAQDANIAIWDVIKTCIRPGSLDASIDANSIEVNDFNAFFAAHIELRAVFLNGTKAAHEYRRRVLPTLTATAKLLPTATLLSTSPANARYSLDQKKTNWAQLASWLSTP